MSYNSNDNYWATNDSSGNLRYVRRKDGTRAVGALTKDGMKALTAMIDDQGAYEGWKVSRLASGEVFMVEEGVTPTEQEIVQPRACMEV